MFAILALIPACLLSFVSARMNSLPNDAFLQNSVDYFAHQFESSNREISCKKEQVVSHLEIEGKRIADVGAGTGLFMQLLAEKVSIFFNYVTIIRL